MSLINVNDVCDFVNEKTFDEIKSFSKMLYVKEQNDLYLLANNNKNREQNEGTFTDGVDRRQGTFTDGVVRRQANGIIFEKGTNKIVAMCYPQIEDVKSAEELNEIVPELVNKNEEGLPDSVSYGRVVSYLIEAIKEQQKQIEELKALIK